MRVTHLKAAFRVPGLRNPHSAGRLKAFLQGLPGVSDVRIQPTTETAYVTYQVDILHRQNLRDQIRQLGFPQVVDT